MLRYLIIFFVLVSFSTNCNAEALLNTTFNCSDWVQGTALNCDGLEWPSGVQQVNDKKTTISAVSNFSGGLGGKGVRFWNNNLATGGRNSAVISWNYLGGGTRPPQPEIWLRWYQRYMPGYKWAAGYGGRPYYDKTFYLFTNAQDTSVIPQFNSGSAYSIYTQNTGAEPNQTRSTVQWEDLHGGSMISDGSWHCFEIHIKMDTTGSYGTTVGANGIGRLWIDGQLEAENFEVNFSGGNATARQGWRYIFFDENQTQPDNDNGEGWTDYDDIVLYNTAPPNTDASGNPFIGPIGWSSGPDTTPPALNLPGLSPTASQTSVAQNAPVTIAFSEPIDCATVNTSTVTLTGSATGWTRTSCSGSIAVFQPTGQLPATTYTVNVGGATGVQDVAGNPMVLESYSYMTSGVTLPPTGTTVFSESFADNSWSSRGWYDGTDSIGSTAGGFNGNALQWSWAQGATRPTGFTTIRRKFSQPVTEFVVDYRIKFSAGWRGSGRAYHPHLLMMQDVADGDYQALASANNSLYFEALANTGAPYTNYPMVAAQDLLRVNTGLGSVPNDLRLTTQTRSAYHCNTPFAASGATSGECYWDGSGYYSTNKWFSPTAIPADTWTRVRTHIKRNTITNGVGNHDGVLRVWLDDTLVIDRNEVLWVAGGYPAAAWDKFILAPWIGDGAPVAQTMWLDSLSVVAVAQDSTAPVRSGGAPSGVLAAGTTTTTLTVITNEPAGCRWGSAPGVSYPLQTAYFDVTGGTTHTHQITGMRDGGSYTRYVRCNDQSGNTNNDDYVISWSVGSGGVGGARVPLRAGAVKVGVGVTPLQ